MKGRYRAAAAPARRRVGSDSGGDPHGLDADGLEVVRGVRVGQRLRHGGDGVHDAASGEVGALDEVRGCSTALPR
jgi:hypothetical protein